MKGIARVLVGLGFVLVPSLASAEVSCRLVAKDFSTVECRVPGEGWVRGALHTRGESSRLPIRSARLGATINGQGIGMIDGGPLGVEKPEISANVRFEEAQPLALLQPQAVYYGKHGKNRPAVISARELAGRYAELGMDRSDALRLAQSALSALLRLPVGHDLRPGTWWGGQSLYAYAFTTSAKVVLFEEDQTTVKAVVGGVAPGTRALRADSAALPAELRNGSFRLARGSSGIFYRPSPNAAWIYFENNGDHYWLDRDKTYDARFDRGRYEAQVIQRSEDRSVENQTLVPNLPKYRYYEADIGGQSYFLVLDRVSSRIVKGHRT